MSRRGHALAVGVAAALIPGMATAWWAANRHEVFPVSKTVFEVIGRPGSGAADYWCAAGDFARTALRSRTANRLYIWKAVGPSVTQPGRRAVQFAFSPPKGAENVDPGYSLSVRLVGDNLTIGAAFQYCLGNDPFDWQRRLGW
ncbi:hypothetical protein C6Y53_18850 [Pukyongiella litopenaei]|uniref:Uncharacterized protein n=2 Tax=Pukyongiella litopenaei TaxID=2605946 RepID=A0A2S0MUJ6_9RHOB|nr:hypothetical protein C6Y53_18850 [Pukyongiella litopenaei]